MGKASTVRRRCRQSRSCLSVFDWDWHAASDDFERAIRLNPRYALARQWYAINCLCPLGEFERARGELSKAAELEPLSLAIATSLGILHFFGRDYDLAISEFRGVLEMDDGFYLARHFLAQAYAEKRMFEESLRELDRAAVANRQSNEMIMAFGYTRALAGQPENALEALSMVSLRRNNRYVSPLLIAQLHVVLQDHNAAFASLEEAFRLRSTDLTWLKVSPAFDAIRQDPRVLDLLNRLGLSQG